MEEQANGSTSLMLTTTKDRNPSHTRNASLESSKLHTDSAHNSNTLELSSDYVQSLPTSPGVASVIGSSEEIISSIVLNTAGISKSGSLSRGSSPASRKKTSSDSTDRGLNSSIRRRSPLVSRKVTIGTETSFSTPTSGRSRFASNNDEDQPIATEDVEGRAASVVSNGSGENSNEGASQRLALPDTEEVDGGSFQTPNYQQKTKEVLDQFQIKIQRTTELIKEEQKVRDDNVNEYLKLSTNADRQQITRIKAVFEKKNQKSAALIQQLQKKLESYHKRREEIERNGIQPTHRQPKEVLRDVSHGLKSVGGNIRDGFSGLSGRAVLMGKPKEIAHLIKNKFGSADNIKEISEGDDDKNHHGSATLPPNSGLHPTPSNPPFVSNPQVSSGTVGSSGGGGGSSGKMESEEGSECNSSITSESIPPNQVLFSSPRNQHGLSFDLPMNSAYIESISQEMQERQDENLRLREEIDMIKQTLSSEVSHLKDCLGDDRFRCERLEEQLNDLTELHQNEMDNLKTTIADMEEKVQYQSEERIRDLHEVFEDCLNRVQRMEHQQAQQQQQFLTLEGLENSNARMLFVKLINILLTLLQVFLLVIATVAGILTPLLQTRTRLLSTAIVCLFLVFVYVQLSEIRDSWHQLMTRFTHSVS